MKYKDAAYLKKVVKDFFVLAEIMLLRTAMYFANALLGPFTRRPLEIP